MNTILSEKDYQAFIVKQLVNNGYAHRVPKEADGKVNYDRSRAMDPEMLFQENGATEKHL